LSQFKDRKLNTRARYLHVLGAFFTYYNGEKLPIKIRTPKILPQYVPGEDIDRLIEGIRGKKSHKKSIDRDVLLIETFRMTGLRRGELANLKTGDLHLDGDDPVVIVKQGKGSKDRAVSLNPYIRDRLASFIKGKDQQDSVFSLAAKTISMKIGQWARKSGVPHLHTHSLRHYVGTTLFERGANPRAIQVALGHQSLDVTMRYASVIGRDIKQTMELLDHKPAQEEATLETAVKAILPLLEEEEEKDADTAQEALLELLEILKDEPHVPSPDYVEAMARHEERVKATKANLGYD